MRASALTIAPGVKGIVTLLRRVSGNHRVRSSATTATQAASWKSGTKPSRSAIAIPAIGPRAIAMFAAAPKVPISAPRRSGGARSATIALAAVGYSPMPQPWSRRTARSPSRPGGQAVGERGGDEHERPRQHQRPTPVTIGRPPRPRPHQHRREGEGAEHAADRAVADADGAGVEGQDGQQQEKGQKEGEGADPQEPQRRGQAARNSTSIRRNAAG